MSSGIKNLIREFGLTDGLLFYSRIKTKKLGWFKSSRKNIAFYLRSNTSDAGIFGQVFKARQYHIPLSFVPERILDLGANIGMSALYFADRFPGATIVALEPDRENFEVALKNTKQNSRIKMLQKGIWNKNTYLEIVDLKAGKDSFMVRETSDNGSGAIEATDIPSIMAGQGWSQIDLLKIDIEGAEKELFSENYESWLPLTKVLIIELHDNMKKGSSTSVFKAISRYNFSFSMKHENLVFTNENF